MTSNYNVIYSESKDYKVGDIYQTNSFNWRLRKFNGLEIKSIGYQFEFTILTFDWNEWYNNNPVFPTTADTPFKIIFR